MIGSGLTAIVDYGLCNINSIARALEEQEARVERARDPHVIERADRIVLPGVGAYGRAMANLNEWRLKNAILERTARSDVPFLGICLGMQLMSTTSEEHGQHVGLGLIEAAVVRLSPTQAMERVPHIGWNSVAPGGGTPLFDGIPANSDFYFVHSYHMLPRDRSAVVGETPYCGGIASAVQVPGRAIFGTQFHPEKSQRYGMRLLKNFLSV